MLVENILKKKTILVTGAGGLIGRALSRTLVDRGHVVRAFGLGEQFFRFRHIFEPLRETGAFSFEIGSILDQHALASAMRGCNAVVHLAAMMGVRKTEAERLRCFDINVNGTQNVLTACVLSRVAHVVSLSSSAVYGQSEQAEVRETDTVRPLNAYGISKLAAEEVTKGYAQAYPELGYTIIRLFSTYGDSGNGQLATDAFVSQVVRGEPPRVFGDGGQIRCFTHVSDVASALLAVLENPVSHGKTYNIGNPTQAISIADLARRVIDIVAPGSGLAVEFLPVPAGSEGKEIRTSVANIDRAREDLGFVPQVMLEEGLRRMADAIRRELMR